MAQLALIATTALSAASAAGAFTGKSEKPPEASDPEVRENKQRLLRARAAQTGRQATILAGKNDTEPQVRRPTLLGGE